MITGIIIIPGNLRLIDTVLTMIILRQQSQDTTNQAYTLPVYIDYDIPTIYHYNEETSLSVYPKIIRIDIILKLSNSGQYTDFSGRIDKRGVQEFFSECRFFESARAICQFFECKGIF